MPLKPVTKTFATILLAASSTSHAASGEMGVGIPSFGIYSAAVGTYLRVNLLNATYGMPAGCTFLMLTPATMGMDTYKIAAATLLMAKATNRAVRFYAHSERDGGCGVDYIQPID